MENKVRPTEENKSRPNQTDFHDMVEVEKAQLLGTDFTDKTDSKDVEVEEDTIEASQADELGETHDYSGYSGADAQERMARRRENPNGGGPTGAYTDVGEGRSGVTKPDSKH